MNSETRPALQGGSRTAASSSPSSPPRAGQPRSQAVPAHFATASCTGAWPAMATAPGPAAARHACGPRLGPPPLRAALLGSCPGTGQWTSIVYLQVYRRGCPQCGLALRWAGMQRVGWAGRAQGTLGGGRWGCASRRPRAQPPGLGTPSRGWQRTRKRAQRRAEVGQLQQSQGQHRC